MGMVKSEVFPGFWVTYSEEEGVMNELTTCWKYMIVAPEKLDKDGNVKRKGSIIVEETTVVSAKSPVATDLLVQFAGEIAGKDLKGSEVQVLIRPF